MDRWEHAAGGRARARARARLWVAALAGLGAGLASGRSAMADVLLISPPPREGDGSPSAGTSPCGAANTSSDGQAPSVPVTVLSPGQTIEVSWSEPNDEDGYFRVAFDRGDGSGIPHFQGPGVSGSGHNPEALCPVDGQVVLAYERDDRSGGDYSLRVTLPEVECQRCTLQLVQYVFGQAQPYAYQCADLVLQQGAGDAGAPDAGGTGLADAGAGDAGAPDAGGAGLADAGAGDAGGDNAGGDNAGGDNAGGLSAGAAESCQQRLVAAAAPGGEDAGVASPAADAGQGAPALPPLDVRGTSIRGGGGCAVVAVNSRRRAAGWAAALTLAALAGRRRRRSSLRTGGGGRSQQDQ